MVEKRLEGQRLLWDPPNRKPRRTEHGPPKDKSPSSRLGLRPTPQVTGCSGRRRLGATSSSSSLLTSRGSGASIQAVRDGPSVVQGRAGCSNSSAAAVSPARRSARSAGPAGGGAQGAGGGGGGGGVRGGSAPLGLFWPGPAAAPARRRGGRRRSGEAGTGASWRGWRSAAGGSPPSRALARAQSGGHAGGGGGSPLGGGEGRQSGLPQGATRGGGGPGLLAALRRVRGGGGWRNGKRAEALSGVRGPVGGVFRFSPVRPARRLRKN